MAAITINLPLYQVLTELKVGEDRARQAAEASIPDLSAFATREDLKTALWPGAAPRPHHRREDGWADQVDRGHRREHDHRSAQWLGLVVAADPLRRAAQPARGRHSSPTLT